MLTEKGFRFWKVTRWSNRNAVCQELSAGRWYWTFTTKHGNAEASFAHLLSHFNIPALASKKASWTMHLEGINAASFKYGTSRILRNITSRRMEQVRIVAPPMYSTLVIIRHHPLRYLLEARGLGILCLFRRSLFRQRRLSNMCGSEHCKWKVETSDWDVSYFTHMLW